MTLPDAEPGHDVLAKVWARKKIEDLSAQMYHEDTPEVIEEITRLALDYRLMSQWTSFVAVDESEVPLTRQQATHPRGKLLSLSRSQRVSILPGSLVNTRKNLNSSMTYLVRQGIPRDSH